MKKAFHVHFKKNSGLTPRIIVNNAGLRIFRNGEGKMMNLPLATSPAFHGENPAFQRFPKHPMGTPQMIIWVPVSQPEKFKKTLPVYIIYISEQMVYVLWLGNRNQNSNSILCIYWNIYIIHIIILSILLLYIYI